MHSGVGRPVRGGEQNIVAVIDHGSEGFIDRLLTTVCNKYLRRIDLNAGIAQGFIRDSLFEFGQTRGGGVAEVFRIIEGFAGSINICAGVGKSGSPAPKPITGRPAALSALALESTIRVAEGAIAPIRLDMRAICECTRFHSYSAVRLREGSTRQAES